MTRNDYTVIANLIRENKNNTWRLAKRLAEYFARYKGFDKAAFISRCVNELED